MMLVTAKGDEETFMSLGRWLRFGRRAADLS
jgi:hypothetical protein